MIREKVYAKYQIIGAVGKHDEKDDSMATSNAYAGSTHSYYASRSAVGNAYDPSDGRCKNFL